MAKASRIEDVIFHADGRVEVKFTEGLDPLPIAWEGNSLIFGDRDQFLEAMAEAEERAGRDLVLLHAAVGRAADPTLGPSFRAALKGKTNRLNTKTTAIISIS